jgi:multidrug resistance efflux pump
VQVGTYDSGPIIAIYADFNSPVKAGQLIAEIDPRPFTVKVHEAAAALGNAQAQLGKDQADQFAKSINARTDLRLSRNFRSSPPIIAQANRLYLRTPPMRAIGPAKQFTEVPGLQHGTSTFEVITDYFLP